MNATDAVRIVEALRNGTPPQRGVEAYSVGLDKLVGGVRQFHLAGIADRGLMRFVSGSWGAGKTHFFRVLRDVGVDANCLVSNVQLNVNEAPLNKFEKVFHAIVRSIQTPRQHQAGAQPQAEPFAEVLSEGMAFLATGVHAPPETVTHDTVSGATAKLMSDRSIDIDFKRLVERYWSTYLSDGADQVAIEGVRADIMQWFAGEGTIGHYRKTYGVNKMVARENAKLMLQSLAGFVRLAGYAGLLILFDEAEQSYSVMRKSALKDAQNNLLALINDIENLRGLFLIYATTPDFYTDPKHGIVTYGALAQRIGAPEDHPPRALEKVWNLDAIEPALGDYQAAGRKIRDIYLAAYGGSGGTLDEDKALDTFVNELHGTHPSMSGVRFWRVLVTALIARCDDLQSGEARPTTTIYRDVMERLRDA